MDGWHTVNAFSAHEICMLTSLGKRTSVYWCLSFSGRDDAGSVLTAAELLDMQADEFVSSRSGNLDK